MIADWSLHIFGCLKIHGGNCETGTGTVTLQNAAHLAKLWTEKCCTSGTYTICHLRKAGRSKCRENKILSASIFPVGVPFRIASTTFWESLCRSRVVRLNVLAQEVANLAAPSSPYNGSAMPEPLVQACKRDPNSLVQATAAHALLPEKVTTNDNFSPDSEAIVTNLCGGSYFIIQASTCVCVLDYAGRHKCWIWHGLQLYERVSSPPQDMKSYSSLQ